MASNHALGLATDVSIGGCSAGALTIYLNIDFFATKIRQFAPRAKVSGLADAGFFLDHLDAQGQSYRTPLFQWGFEAWNASAVLAKACLAAYVATPWKCIFAQYTAQFIATPTFFLNSRFDSCQLNGCELNLPDVNQGWDNMSATSQAAALTYSGDFNLALEASGFAANTRHGGFVTSCLVHCDAGDSAWIQTLAQPRSGSGNATTPSLAFAAWLGGVAVGVDAWWVDQSRLPNETKLC